jgi:hypothetical protein
LPEQESPAPFLFALLTVFRYLRHFIDFPIDDNRTLFALARTCPPSSLAWRSVSQNGETYFDAESRKKFSPRYGFLLTRLRGSPVEVHGLRHGTSPTSRKLIIFSFTIA